MEYTGRHKRVCSKRYHQDVDVLEYASNDSFPYMECSICGKPIIRKMFVVQDPDSGVEIAYLGSECVKRI